MKLSLLEVFDGFDEDDAVDRASERAYRHEEEGRGPNISFASIEKKLRDERQKQLLHAARNSKPAPVPTREEKLEDLKRKYREATSDFAKNAYSYLIRKLEPNFEDKTDPDGWDL